MARSLGRLAFTVGGAIVGSMLLPGAGTFLGMSFGAGLGGAIGGAVGGALGSALIPMRLPGQTGPRLADLTATSATEGAARMRGFGTIKMAGNAIWCPGLIEEKTTEKVGGKGGPTQKTTTYTYYSSFALGFGEGVAQDVLRIWVDEKLIYDKTGTSDITAVEGLTFRFYTGAEDQEPDPLILSQEGVKDTPAFRGECYIVFENLPVADYGNRPIPNVTAEIVWTGAVAAPLVENVSPMASGIATDMNAYQIRDWTKEYVYEVNNNPKALRRINTRGLVEDRQALFSDVLDGTGFETLFPLYGGVVTPKGQILCSIGSFNGTPIVLIDPVSMTTLDTFGSSDISSAFTPTRFPPILHWTTLRVTYYNGVLGDINDYAIGSAFFAQGNVGVLRVDQDPVVGQPPNTMGYVWDSETAMTSLGIGDVVIPIARYPSREISNFCWLVGGEDAGGGTQVKIAQLEIFLSAHYDPTELNQGVSFTNVATLAIGDIVTGATEYFDLRTVFLDESDDTLIILIRPTTTTYQLFKWSPTSGIVWSIDVTSSMADTRIDGSQSLLKGNTLGWVKADGVGTMIDTRTGEVIESSVNFVTTHDGHVGVWNSFSQSYSVVNGTTHIMRKYLFGRGTSVPESVANIITQVAEWDGLTPADIDVSDLTADLIPGYALTSGGMSGRAGIEPLQMLFFFDGVESDDVIAFRKRGSASARTIDADDLIVMDNDTGDAWVTTDQQEVELPQRVTFAYQSTSNDYQISTQSAKRVLAPLPVMRSVATGAYEFTAALNDDFARQAAEKFLYTMWVGRTSHQHKLPWTHIDLEPTDVYTVNPTANSSFLVRLGTSQFGGDMVLSNAATAEDVGQYSSTIPAASGSGGTVQTIPTFSPVQLFLMDMPLLRNFDEVAGRTGTPLYFGIGAYHDNDPAKANIYKSSGDSVYEVIDRRILGVAWGGTMTAMPNTSTPFMTDNTSTLTVFMQDGGDQLSSITELQMLNGGNAAALLKVNGEVELIHFMTVVSNVDGSYTLSGFLRGRRGTDTMVNDHTAGELFVLLDTLTVAMTPLLLSELNVSRYYKAVPDGKGIEETTPQILASKFRGLMPYAPSEIEGALSGSDIVLTWERRDRLGYDLVDGLDTQPLSEDSELYTIEIFSGPAGSIVRTVTGLTTPTYTYTSANQTADGFTPPLSQLTLKVYQVSGQVGNGFAAETTISVA